MEYLLLLIVLLCALGNRSSDSTHNDKYMSYRGIENLYADIIAEQERNRLLINELELQLGGN